jgi:hypothetical protein
VCVAVPDGQRVSGQVLHGDALSLGDPHLTAAENDDRRSEPVTPRD